MNRKLGFLLITGTILFFACSKSNDDGGSGGGGGGGGGTDCSSVAKSFSANVKPIIDTKCAISGCHESGSVNGPGALTTYTQISAAKSLIRSAVQSGTMPKTGSLTTTQKNAIICWIDAGGLDN